jgi:hypothetical protein
VEWVENSPELDGFNDFFWWFIVSS